MLVLDEADEMLNKGFKEQIYDVYRYLPPATQVCLRDYPLFENALNIFFVFNFFILNLLIDLISKYLALNFVMNEFSYDDWLVLDLI